MIHLHREDFTARELQVMENAKTGAMYDKRLFNKLEKLGVLKMASETGTRMKCFWGYGYHTIKYIRDCEDFRVEGINGSFGHEYFSGCFYPYFVKCA